MAKEPTQKAKLSLKALELTLTKDVTNDYYLMPKLQKCLDMADLAREVAAMSTRQEDEDEIKRIGNLLMKRMVWYLSSGYSLSTVLGYFRPTVNGVLLEPELATAPSRDRIKLGISYSMSQDMRQALAETELDVEIQKATSGPQLYSVVSAQDALHPDAATRGQGVPVSAGEACIIKGKNLKVGGTDEKIGVTLTRPGWLVEGNCLLPRLTALPQRSHTGGLRDARIGFRRVGMERDAVHTDRQQRSKTATSPTHSSHAGLLRGRRSERKSRWQRRQR